MDFDPAGVKVTNMKLDLLPKVCYDNSIPHRTGATEMKRIMIIEDEPALRDELSVLLQNAGYEPIAVTDYDNVSEQMKVADADLILLDINLPNVKHFCRTSAKNTTRPLLCLQAVPLR